MADAVKTGRIISPDVKAPPPWPLLGLGAWAVGAVITLLAGASESDAMKGIHAVSMGVCMLGACALSSFVEQRAWLRMDKMGRGGRVGGALVLPGVLFMGGMFLTALVEPLLSPLGLSAAWAPPMFVGTLWMSGAAVGSFSIRLIDEVISLFVQRFRTRVVLAILVLLALVATVAFFMALGVDALMEALLEGNAKFNVDLGDGAKNADVALVAEFAKENSLELMHFFGLLGVLLCVPAVTSAAGKLADAVMERILPLNVAMDLVAKGERDLVLEEGGSQDFRELSHHFNQMVDGLRLAGNMERAFGAYVSPEVIARIKAQHGNANLPAQLKVASVLFSDVRGFTTLSETLAPDVVVSILNRYFERMVEIVNRQEGYLDKFIGDAVVAVFNGPLDQKDHAARAVACAVEMQLALEEMNAANAFPEVGRLDVGVGVATGPMVCGNIGSNRKLQYTVIGDTVNLASRMEGLTKGYGAKVLVSDATVQALPAQRFSCREVDRVAAKGKREAVTIHEVLDALPKDARSGRQGSLEEYNAGRTSLVSKDAQTAAKHFEACLQADPSDGAAAAMLDRSREFLAHGFPAGWDGVQHMTHK